MTRIILKTNTLYTRLCSEEDMKWLKQHHQDQHAYTLIIIHRDTEERIGFVALPTINPIHKRATVTYGLEKQFARNGYMTEIVSLFVGYCFRKYKLNKIEATIPENELGSWRVLEKIGFHRDGILRQHMYEDGQFYDSYVYSILNDEYKGICIRLKQ